MPRAAPAVLLLLLLAGLAPLAEAQSSTSPQAFTNIPTQRTFDLGGLGFTVWVMRDTRSVAYTPELSANPIQALWNLNFTAGSGGLAYVKAEVKDGRNHAFTAELRSPSPLFGVQQDNLTGPKFGAAQPCTPGPVLSCNVTAARGGAEYAFQFYTGITQAPGTLDVTFHVEASLLGDNGTQPEGARDETYTLSILDPVPRAAARQDLGAATVHAWVGGGFIGAASSGCLAGAQAPQDLNVTRGRPAVLCVLAVPKGNATLRMVVEPQPPAGLQLQNATWTSPPFTARSGGADAPVQSFPLLASADTPEGPGVLPVRVRLEEQAGAGWAQAGEATLQAPYMVQAGPVVTLPQRGPNWLFAIPVLLVAAGGLGYLVYRNRQPKLQPRSQALRSEMEHKKKGDDGDEAAVAARADAQRQEVAEAAWDKKRKILEAKREDILKSIRIAEERKDRGEITDHILNGIRERKERQLEQLEKEMEELR